MALLNRLSRASFDDRKDVRPAPELEGIDAFASEESLAGAFASEESLAGDEARADGEGIAIEAGEIDTRAASPFRRGVLAAWAVGVVLVAAAGAGAWAWTVREPATPAPASLTVQTTPPGLQVAVEGKPAGTTPVTLSLPAGDYRVALAAPDGRRRDFIVTLAAGASVIRDVEIAPAVVVPASTGGLRVDTEPARQVVLVDGVERGLSPITVTDLPPGEHVVIVRAAGGNLRRTINVREGETVSLVVSGTGTPVLRAGWVTFASPIALELRENGSVVGTTAVDRLMLPAGEHDIEMVNDALGFRATRRISIAADRTTSVPVDVPSGMININALPWAEVWLGGERIGETPIANLSRPIGSYDVLLRHPQFGERRARLTVSTKQTARLGVDMRTP